MFYCIRPLIPNETSKVRYLAQLLLYFSKLSRWQLKGLFAIHLKRMWQISYVLNKLQTCRMFLCYRKLFGVLGGWGFCNTGCIGKPVVGERKIVKQGKSEYTGKLIYEGKQQCVNQAVYLITWQNTFSWLS